jgi:hypothetical protein
MNLKAVGVQNQSHISFGTSLFFGMVLDNKG